jgi:Tfp pilus assembly protein PilF
MHPTEGKLHAGVHVHFGNLYQRRGKKDAAREEWQIALRFDPTHAEALKLIGQDPGLVRERK